MQCFLIIFFCFVFTDSGSESGSHKSVREKRTSGPNDGNKPTRVRTVLNEKQLHTLRLVGFFVMALTFGVTGSRWPLEGDCLANARFSKRPTEGLLEKPSDLLRCTVCEHMVENKRVTI